MMTVMSTKSVSADRKSACSETIGFPCVDGPLVGEFHQQGEVFELEGSRIGLEDGTYRLVGGSYVWSPTPKAPGGP